MLRFWLQRGVDGFRIDAAGVLVKDSLLRDDPPNPKFHEKMPQPERFKRVYTDSRPETLEYLTELRAVVDEFSDRVLLGEVDTSGERLADFYGRQRFELQCGFHVRTATAARRRLGRAKFRR
jgi:alpha-glucosidase